LSSLAITSVTVDMSIDEKKSRMDIVAKVKTVGQTGVEMEALTAVSVAALTIYDMCKAVDKEIDHFRHHAHGETRGEKRRIQERRGLFGFTKNCSKEISKEVST